VNDQALFSEMGLWFVKTSRAGQELSSAWCVNLFDALLRPDGSRQDKASPAVLDWEKESLL